ncbi:Uncharacterised protein [Yersinia intermedia]|nr:Uncharacterised protein [Yersinia intermedia]
MVVLGGAKIYRLECSAQSGDDMSLYLDYLAERTDIRFYCRPSAHQR